MKNVLTILNKDVIATIVALFALVPSLTALVSADSSSQTCTPPPAQDGVNRPVGADAGTYTYDCTNGLWENGYYAFDPSTGLTTPTYSITYTYDPSTT